MMDFPDEPIIFVSNSIIYIKNTLEMLMSHPTFVYSRYRYKPQRDWTFCRIH